MITVNIKRGDQELALIRIEAQEYSVEEKLVRYTAEFVVEREGATGLHRRVFEIPVKGNVLAILDAAIHSLDEPALELESGE